MKRISQILLLLCLLLQTSCVPSIHPFYTAKDLIFDKGLLGTWVNKDNKESWKFEADAADPKRYQLIYADENGLASEFEACLMTLGTNRFLDLFLVDPKTPGELKMNTLAQLSLITWPGHLLLRLSQSDNSFRIQAMDAEWLSKHLEKHPRSLRHERFKKEQTKGHINSSDIFLTAETRDLQKFVQAHLSDLFSEEELNKQTPFFRK